MLEVQSICDTRTYIEHCQIHNMGATPTLTLIHARERLMSAGEAEMV